MIGRPRLSRAALFGLAALALSAAGADAQRGGMRGGPMGGGPGGGNPSAIVAAELGFARLAQDKGQWTAFRETADKDAVMFTPDAVNAQSWLKGRADPAKAIAWQPYRVFVSCDGSYALSTGPWTDAAGATGTFNTLWRRQKDGRYKWVVDFGSATPVPRQEDVIIEGKVAECRGHGGRPDDAAFDAADRGKQPKPGKYVVVPIPNPPPASGEGQSLDGSLRWRWTKGARETVFEVLMRYQGSEQTVIHEAAPVAGAS